MTSGVTTTTGETRGTGVTLWSGETENGGVTDIGLPGGLNGNYVAEDGTTPYVAEDGATHYVTET